MRKTTRGIPVTTPPFIPTSRGTAIPVRRGGQPLRRDSSDSLITPLGEDAQLDDTKPTTVRDAFDQLEDTNASTGVAPGDPGSDKPYEGDQQ
jgi:hypothetical protein